MMQDLISRQAAIDALNMADDKGQIHSILDVNDAIKSLPSAQPERKTGQCIKRKKEQNGKV